jgi:hypothetical protein
MMLVSYSNAVGTDFKRAFSLRVYLSQWHWKEETRTERKWNKMRIKKKTYLVWRRASNQKSIRKVGWGTDSETQQCCLVQRNLSRDIHAQWYQGICGARHNAPCTSTRYFGSLPTPHGCRVCFRVLVSPVSPFWRFLCTLQWKIISFRGTIWPLVINSVWARGMG